MLEHPELSSQAFTDADIQSARALAVIWQDDVGNLHAGLRAQELNPGLRLVLAIFNRRLGEHIRMFFPDCAVLSGTAMSAPSFVAAALGEPAASHVRVQRRTLFVARPADVAPGAVICGLATAADGQASPRLLPPGDSTADGPADLVLAVADGTPRNPLTRRRNPAGAAAGLLRRLVFPSDIVNLETALTARALRDDLRIVLRLTDDDLAERLQKTTGNIISRSVPYLAAPAFAAAMLEHQVLRTIAVGRHVLLIADVRAGPGLAGSFIADTEEDGQARVLALQAGGAAALDWSPHRGYLLAAGDRMIVLATQEGPGPVPVRALTGFVPRFSTLVLLVE